ncbi:Uncharacterised protein [uncultured archaeon]|nr:Uncharacterised protein [uncultured archaeon]
MKKSIFAIIFILIILSTVIVMLFTKSNNVNNRNVISYQDKDCGFSANLPPTKKINSYYTPTQSGIENCNVTEFFFDLESYSTPIIGGNHEASLTLQIFASPNNQSLYQFERNNSDAMVLGESNLLNVTIRNKPGIKYIHTGDIGNGEQIFTYWLFFEENGKIIKVTCNTGKDNALSLEYCQRLIENLQFD